MQWEIGSGLFSTGWYLTKHCHSDVRMFPWQMTCHIGAKDMQVTFKIMTEGVSPQFIEIFPHCMTTGVSPVGISETPMK